MTIKELEEELTKAKAKPYIEALLKKRDEMKESIGKCYSSHSLSRRYLIKNNEYDIKSGVQRTTDIWIVQIKDVLFHYKYEYNVFNENSLYNRFDTLDKIEPVLYGDLLHIFKNNNKFNIEKISNTIIDKKYKKEISTELYTNLLFLINQHLDTIISISANNLKDDFLTSDIPEDNFSREKTLEERGYIMIALNGSECYHIGDWHPFVYGNKILCCNESVKFLEEKIKEEKDIISRTSDFHYGDEFISAEQQCQINRNIVEDCINVNNRIKKILKDQNNERNNII